MLFDLPRINRGMSPSSDNHNNINLIANFYTLEATYLIPRQIQHKLS